MKRIINTIFILLFAMYIVPTNLSANNKQKFCKAYADKAVSQYKLGKRHNLPGIVPPAWSGDRNGHYSWCMTVPESWANNENKKRRVYLDKHLPQNTTEKGMVAGTVSGAMGNKKGGSVAATPISIPRPVEVEIKHKKLDGSVNSKSMPGIGGLSGKKDAPVGFDPGLGP